MNKALDKLSMNMILRDLNKLTIENEIDVDQYEEAELVIDVYNFIIMRFKILPSPNCRKAILSYFKELDFTIDENLNKDIYKLVANTIKEKHKKDKEFVERVFSKKNRLLKGEDYNVRWWMVKISEITCYIVDELPDLPIYIAPIKQLQRQIRAKNKRRLSETSRRLSARPFKKQKLNIETNKMVKQKKLVA